MISVVAMSGPVRRWCPGDSRTMFAIYLQVWPGAALEPRGLVCMSLPLQFFLRSGLVRRWSPRDLIAVQSADGMVWCNGSASLARCGVGAPRTCMHLLPGQLFLGFGLVRRWSSRDSIAVHCRWSGLARRWSPRDRMAHAMSLGHGTLWTMARRTEGQCVVCRKHPALGTLRLVSRLAALLIFFVGLQVHSMLHRPSCQV